METRAYLKGTRLSPQKAGLVANAIRGKSVQDAMDFLNFNKQKGSAVIKKLLESAIANAEHNNKADVDLLSVKSRLDSLLSFRQRGTRIDDHLIALAGAAARPPI